MFGFRLILYIHVWQRLTEVVFTRQKGYFAANRLIKLILGSFKECHIPKIFVQCFSRIRNCRCVCFQTLRMRAYVSEIIRARACIQRACIRNQHPQIACHISSYPCRSLNCKFLRIQQFCMTRETGVKNLQLSDQQG